MAAAVEQKVELERNRSSNRGTVAEEDNEVLDGSSFFSSFLARASSTSSLPLSFSW